MRGMHFFAARRTFVLLVCGFLAPLAAAGQPLLKSAVQVDPGNTKLTGQVFAYRLTYNCSSTSGPCLNAEVDDLLPAEVQYVATVPASPTGDVAAINVTANYLGSGRTRVQFVMINPLPAGNSGDLLVDVRFPNGSTPNGTPATNAADALNLGASPGTFTTPPVTVTAVASLQVTLQKTLLTSPANLDMPESYRLRIAVSGNAGSLSLTAVGPVTDTLPAGTVFTSASPAADCEPGCDGTTPATVTWTSPCSLPVAAGSNCDLQVNVIFPSATFPSGTSVTNSFTATATPLGQASQSLGTAQVVHSVTTFVPSPSASLTKGIAAGSPNPPTLNQSFGYDLTIANDGNVPLDNLVVIDTLPVELQLASVTTGAYASLADFAAGVGVQVSYEKNTAPGVFTLWGSSPNATTNATLTTPPPGLGAGEFVTRVRWEYGQVQPGMSATTRPVLSGRVVSPDNAGNPVALGDSIQNCADLAAVYTAGPTNVARSSCKTFALGVSPDFGDAPDSYGTTLAQNGARHGVVAGFSLGATEDAEPDGQPSAAANGDGADEDGVALPAAPLIACTTVGIPVTLTNTAGIATPLLDAWVDFDGDGHFDDPRDRIATGLALAAGGNTVTVNVPCDARSVPSFARFRLSSTGVAGPGGSAVDGEVEDYAVVVAGLDFGDAPDPSYPTLLASNGARHAVLPVGNPTLGALVDTEPDGQPSAAFSGDDGNGIDDEDGVSFPAPLVPGTMGNIQLTTGATGGVVSCWIDFNENGSWADPGEQVVIDLALAANTTVDRAFPVPAASLASTQAATRCRISSQAGLGVTGLAPDGEVEDHPAPIGVPRPLLGVAKRLVAVAPDPGDPLAFQVTFSFVLANLGNVPLTNVALNDDLAAVFAAPASFNVVSVSSGDFAVNGAYDGSGSADLLAAGNVLRPGGTATVELVVHLQSGRNPGPYSNSATGTASDPTGATIADSSQDGTDPDPDRDGNPGNNSAPTPILLPLAIAAIPALGTYGPVALAALLASAALVVLLRRRSQAGSRG